MSLASLQQVLAQIEQCLQAIANELAQHHADATVQRWAANALQQLGDDRGLIALQTLTQNNLSQSS